MSAEDLLGKLNQSKQSKENRGIAHKDEPAEQVKENGANDSIDLTDDIGNSSDSELDINELLKKYMPEYSDNGDSSSGSGVLPDTGNTAEDTTAGDDAKLISALDSAFSAPSDSDELVQRADFINEYELGADDAGHEDIEPEEDITADEYDGISYDEPEDDDADEEYGNDYEDAGTLEDIFADDEEKKPKKKFGFFGLFKQNDDRNVIDDDWMSDKGDLAVDDADTDADNTDEDVPQDADEYDAADDDADETAADGGLDYIQDEDIDPTDINLMVAFGLDGGEGDKSDKARAHGDRLEAHQAKRDSLKFKLDRPEFVDKAQIPEIRTEQKKRLLALKVKFGICAVLTAILMIFENIAPLTKLFLGSQKQFAGVLDPAVYPTVYIMVSLQIMLLACFCAFDEIVAGFKYLFRGVPKPESFTALLVVAGIVYSAVLPQALKPADEPVMFNFIVALAALFTLLYSIWNTKREIMNFDIVTNKKDKHIVRRMQDDESEGELQAFADNDDICDIMKIEKTDFVDGFFSRIKKPDPATGSFMVFIMSLSVALAVIFGIIAGVKGNNAASVCRVVYTSFLIIAPLSLFITFSYPFYRANIIAKDYDSAIIGETSLDEYSNASVITFDDKNVFPSYSVKVQNIRIYNNARIDRVLYYASSVFAYAGGPLQDVFEIATKDIDNSNDVNIYDTEGGFLATQVDGVNIIFGNCEALTARGLAIPENIAQDDVDLSDELSIMYMFRENKLVAKMYIKYVMDSDIDLILKQYAGSGLYICMRTFDPNIDEAMISKSIKMKRIPLKIIRYSNAEEVGRYIPRVDSGLATCGSPKSLLQVISYCSKVLHTKKTNVALSALSTVIGAAILILLLLSNSFGILNSLILAVYQIVWMIPSLISSRMFIR